MRIIAGQFRGRKLAAARDLTIRPAADRVKETVFNILQNRLPLDSIHVLDLFAGTGSLGLEAISRGAAHATFVEISEKSLRVLRSNIVLLGCKSQCTVARADGLKFVATSDQQFELIFADPPYRYEHTTEIPGLIFTRNLLKKEGFLIIEHSAATRADQGPGYACVLRKEFGQTIVSFFAHESQQHT